MQNLASANISQPDEVDPDVDTVITDKSVLSKLFRPDQETSAVRAIVPPNTPSLTMVKDQWSLSIDDLLLRAKAAGILLGLDALTFIKQLDDDASSPPRGWIFHDKLVIDRDYTVEEGLAEIAKHRCRAGSLREFLTVLTEPDSLGLSRLICLGVVQRGMAPQNRFLRWLGCAPKAQSLTVLCSLVDATTGIRHLRVQEVRLNAGSRSSKAGPPPGHFDRSYRLFVTR